MFVTALFLAAAAGAPSPVIVAGSRGAAEDALVLDRAMRAPVRRHAGKRHYCFDETITSAVPRRVCRTRIAWRRLGLDPVVS